MVLLGKVVEVVPEKMVVEILCMAAVLVGSVAIAVLREVGRESLQAYRPKESSRLVVASESGIGADKVVDVCRWDSSKKMCQALVGDHKSIEGDDDRGRSMEEV